ncbi:MAG: cytochrome c biogenesis protein DipZ [Anaerolineae bacterium]|nr:cytochrome c biogenesis protein DipZ [Gemmatimonadaceae bacterium]
MLFLLAFIGGVLTILSPCILPVVPLIFGRADRPFRREGLPLLLGLAVTFSIVATAATVTAGWVAQLNEASRWIAMILLAGTGMLLLLPRAAGGVTRPIVRAGQRLENWGDRQPPVVRSLAVGAAVGLLWAPCAGPVLGLVVAAAALQGGGVESAFLFLTFALGAATSLSLVLLAGGRAFGAMNRTMRAELTVRRALGVLTLAGVAVIAAGWDRALYAKGGVPGAEAAEKLLTERYGRSASAPDSRPSLDVGESLDDFARKREMAAKAAALSGPALADEGEMPELNGVTAWINSPVLTRDSLRGKVVLVEFWTYSCYNCLNALPHVKSLEAKYRDDGLVVIGVHTPEFPREKVLDNVRDQVKTLGVVFPVAVDNDYRVWNAFRNRYWPAAYYVDKNGRIRYHHFGEGRYKEQEQVVRKLLAEPYSERKAE